MTNITLDREIRRKKRVSKNLFGTADRPRISVFMSNRYNYAQAIDDVNRNTVGAYSSLQKAKSTGSIRSTKVIEAKKVGLELANILKKKGISKAIFDRGVYGYKGRVKALTEGLREGGLKV